MQKKVILICLMLSGLSTATAQKIATNKLFSESLMQDSCTFATTGRNTYFILEVGYQQVFKGVEGKDTTTLIITVLNDTKMIGNIETRIVEENEMVNGKPVEISRNYFAFCKQTGSIYYFGEDVDIYKNGKITSHDGAWVAIGKNKSGVQMPGLVLLGARYYQEIAPATAMDRAEILSMAETMKTPAGNFVNVVKVEETSALKPNEKEYKYYAPKIGLIKDGDLLLTKAGFVK